MPILPRSFVEVGKDQVISAMRKSPVSKVAVLDGATAADKDAIARKIQSVPNGKTVSVIIFQG